MRVRRDTSLQINQRFEVNPKVWSIKGSLWLSIVPTGCSTFHSIVSYGSIVWKHYSIAWNHYSTAWKHYSIAWNSP